MWTRWYGECSWVSPNKPQFILVMIIWRIYIQSKISHKEQWNNWSLWRASWSENRQKFKRYPWSFGKTILGIGRLCWLTGQFSCQQRKLMYSPIQYCAWKSRKRMEGETRLVYEFIPMSKVGSNRRGADGVRVEIFPRIHYIADSRRDPEHDEWNSVWTWTIPRTDHLHVNVQRHCMVRKRKRRIVYCELPKCSRFCEKIRARTLVVSRAWIRKEVVPNSYVQTEWDRGAEDMMLNFCESGHPEFCGSSAPERGDLNSNGIGKMSVHFCDDDQHRWIGSSHDHLRQSAQYLRSTSGDVRRAGLQNLLFRSYRVTCCSGQSRDIGDSNTIVDYEQITSDRWQCAGKFAAISRPKLRKISRSSSIDQTVLSNVGITKTVAKGQYFTTLDDAELDKVWGSCRENTLPRDNAASKVKRWTLDETRRSVQFWRWQSVIIKAVTESRSCWWWSLFMGDDCEWNTQIRDGNDWGNPRRPHRLHWRKYRETCGWSKTETNLNDDNFFFNDKVAISSACVDCRGTRSARQELFRSVKKDDQIASTRSFSTSRRRRSSRIQSLGTDVSFRIFVFSTLVTSSMAELLA